MQIFIQNEVRQHLTNEFRYLQIYRDNCGIGSAGVLHLSKAKWGRLNRLSLGRASIIKNGVRLLAKIRST
jgi:hypothetical protein